MTQSRTPTLAEVITAAVDARLPGLRVSLPGKVLAYDPTTQTADVQPLLMELAKTEEGADLLEQLPVVPKVPVVFPGAGGFRVTFPVQVGDSVLLVFADRSLDVWQSKGGLVDPIDTRRHDLADAVAIVGLRDLAHAFSSAPTDRMTIGKDGGPTIEITPTTVELGPTVAGYAGARVGRVGDAVSVLIPHGTVITPTAPAAGSPISVASDITVTGTITAGAPGVKA